MASHTKTHTHKHTHLLRCKQHVAEIGGERAHCQDALPQGSGRQARRKGNSRVTCTHMHTHAQLVRSTTQEKHVSTSKLSATRCSLHNIQTCPQESTPAALLSAPPSQPGSELSNSCQHVNRQDTGERTHTVILHMTKPLCC
jgi:hypothetical protein